ncbi:hypothetical protein Slin14017_G002580 [Septoria linicola]|nr:hypothetical protein Slin14017_G002580 [Septoria linicola]
MVRLDMLAAGLLAFCMITPSLAKIPTNQQNIRDIFKIDDRDPAQFPSSCLRRINPADPNSPIIWSKTASFGARQYPLANIWYQAYSMVVQARTVLQASMWLKNFEVMKSIYSFWGLKPDKVDGKYVEPRALWQVQKITAIRRRYEGVQAMMETVRADDDRQKPKIWCDGTYLLHIDVDRDPMRDATGRLIVKEDRTGYYSVREWEAKWGRTVDDRWFLYYQVGPAPKDERAYITIPREAAPEGEERNQYPFPLDTVTGHPNPCKVTTRNAMVLHAQRPAADANGGMGAYAQADHIILCPRSFLDGRMDEDDYFLRTKMVENGSILLDAMKVVVLTLFHEFLHLVYPNGCPDVYPCLPKKDASGTIIEKFPHFQSGFDCDRSPRPIYGAGQAMSLARWEVALDDSVDPPVEFTKIREMWSWQTPEPFAWFARAMQMTLFAKQDWSDGTCRPAGSKFTGCTARIPEFPAAKGKRVDGEGEGIEIVEQVEGCGEDADL